MIFLQHFLCLGQTNKGNSRINDTSFLKSVKYSKLNNLVSYYILDKGMPADTSRLTFCFTPVATYRYYNHRYEKVKTDTPLTGRSFDMTKFILSNKFSGIKHFDALFKINSKIAVAYKPRILRKMTITPRSTKIKDLSSLISKLKGESFVSNVSVDTSKLKLFKFSHRPAPIFITVTLDVGITVVVMPG